MHHKYSLQKPNFTAENLDVLNVIRDEGYTHSHRNGRLKHGFIYIVRGEMRYDFLEEEHCRLQLQAGSLLFVPKNSIYSCTYLQDSTEIKIVQFDLSGGELPSYLKTPKYISLPNAEKLMNAFFPPAYAHSTAHPFYSLSCFYNLMWQVDEHCTKVPTKYKRILNALSELSAHYTQNHPIGHYAALCSMSEPSFRRLFREYVGQSPVDYRNALRLEAARAKLQSGEYNVSEAARDSGFSNLSFFIRLYKQKYGYTPKKE